MAYTEERKIWLDKNGKVLVDKDGKPFYTISCCCGSTCCWQLYEASCVNSDGIPAYGTAEEAPGPRHWTTPRLYMYTCTADCEGSSVFGMDWRGNEGTWRLENPGTAYYALKRTDIPVCSILHVDEQGNSSWEVPCSRPAAFVPAPDIPCSCEILDWGYRERKLPYIEYECAFCHVSTMYSKDGGPKSTCIGSSKLPIWEVPEGLLCSNTSEPEAVWYSIRPEGRLAYYYMNYGHAPLLDKVMVYGGDLTDYYGKSEFFQTNANALAWLWPYELQLHATNLAAYDYNGLDGVESDLYLGLIRYPFNTNLMLGRGVMWASNLSVFSAGTRLTDYTWHTEFVGTIASSQLVTRCVATCFPMEPEGLQFDCSFASDQWGSLIISAGEGDATLHWVREATGADCVNSDTPTAVGTVNPHEQVVLDGSPEWYYRTYFTTEFPLAGVNEQNRLYAEGKGSWEEGLVKPDNMKWSFQAQAMQCPQYNFLLYVQGQSCCFNDPPHLENFGIAPEEGEEKDKQEEAETTTDNEQGEGNKDTGAGGPCCVPYYHKERVFARGERNPQGLIWRETYSGFHDYTSLMHEAEESVDENGNEVQGKPFRVFNQGKDGHLYYVSRLTIHNYPSWKTKNLCVDSLNANLYDVPKVDFSYDAQLCVDGYVLSSKYKPPTYSTAECAYPKTNLKLDDAFLEHKYRGDESLMGYWRFSIDNLRRLRFVPRGTKYQLNVSPVGQFCSVAYGKNCTSSLVSVYKDINTKVSTYTINTNGETASKTYCEFDIADWWKSGSGCPNYNINAVVSLKLEVHENRPTGNDVSTKNETTDLLSAHRDVVRNRFMWDGKVLDPYIFPMNENLSFRKNMFSVYPVTSTTTNHWQGMELVTTFVTSYLDGGVYFYQQPTSGYCCPEPEPSDNDNDGDI